MAAIAVLAISAYATYSIARLERTPIEKNPADYGLKYKDISFKSRDGLTIKGWWIEGSIGDRVIVLVHGSGDNRAEPAGKMLGITKEAINHGYSVLMFDMRGHGESEAGNVSAGLYERYDLLGAVDYLKQRGTIKIGVIGYSLGAATTMMAIPDSEEIDAVVSDSGYADLTDIIRSEFDKRSNLPLFFIPLILYMAKISYDVDFTAVKPIQAVQQTDIPLFIIHGERDDTVPVEHAYRLAEASKNPDSQLWVLPKAGHTNTYFVGPEEYINRVLNFFDKALE
jgi:dipeptidyl aminopeptidase/acylaminoacyl peptidase